MKDKEIKTKGVAFNRKDPFQKRLLEYSNQFTNFSSYVKALIQRDMEGWTVKQNHFQPETKKEITPEMLDRLI
jgi:hypothetical protein